MTEEPHDSDRLKWAWPVFGLFHLRKWLLELIIKEFRGKGSKDFAHLDAMITKVNMKGFRDDKCEHFSPGRGFGTVGLSIHGQRCNNGPSLPPSFRCYRYRTPTSQRNELLAQASLPARISGSYIGLKDTIRFERVGKLPALFRLLLMVRREQERNQLPTGSHGNLVAAAMYGS
jgi:hypothetical protein